MYTVTYADFGIEKKRTDENGTIIALYIHRRESNNYLTSLGWYNRQAIVDHIKQGNSYMTIHIDSSGNTWSMGTWVHVVKTPYGDYLRTDRNQIASDNLSELPEG